ncbi:unnamed protein product [Nezara viridula]|uniref:Uncharacterized protein n=1 Tax=Nezara viridula TaxID=85310 RepID=A0A9P0HKU7_NEZVI|nr:unnamed protein product [Nezara viridula]
MLRFLNSGPWSSIWTSGLPVQKTGTKNFSSDINKLKEHLKQLEELKKIINSEKVDAEIAKLKERVEKIGQLIRQMKENMKKPGGDE